MRESVREREREREKRKKRRTGVFVGACDGTYVSPFIVYVRDGRRREMRGRETVSERERACEREKRNDDAPVPS